MDSGVSEGKKVRSGFCFHFNVKSGKKHSKQYTKRAKSKKGGRDKKREREKETRKATVSTKTMNNGDYSVLVIDLTSLLQLLCS